MMIKKAANPRDKNQAPKKTNLEAPHKTPDLLVLSFREDTGFLPEVNQIHQSPSRILVMSYFKFLRKSSNIKNFLSIFLGRTLWQPCADSGGGTRGEIVI
jgi:hypothetical protein